MAEKWNKVRDFFYKVKLFIGFYILGWHKPVGWDYGYFTGQRWLVLKRRDENRVIHTFPILLPKEGIDHKGLWSQTRS